MADKSDQHNHEQQTIKHEPNEEKFAFRPKKPETPPNVPPPPPPPTKPKNDSPDE